MKSLPTPTMFLCRGLSGSGKSTLAEVLAPGANFSADMFFTSPTGEYTFVGKLIPRAHDWCREQVLEAMKCGSHPIAVHNTFSQNWEMAPYIQLAEEYGYNVFVVECQNMFGNVHNVGPDTIQRVKARWEPRLIKESP